MSEIPGGLYVPVATPFDDAGDADVGLFAEQLSIYNEHPLSGVLLFGTSGEGPLLDDEEECVLLAAARRVLAPGRVLLAQIGRESSRAACRAAQRAVDAGADGLLALPPRYYSAGPAEFEAYYRAIRDAAGVPLFAYHIPQRSRVDLPARVLIDLAADGVLAGLNESAGSIDLQASLREAAGPDFKVLNGSAAIVVRSLRAGAAGAILAVATAVPEVAAALVEAVAGDDRETADRLQTAILPLAEAFAARFGVAGIKAALDLRGWPGGGSPRAPWTPLDEHDRAVVGAALETAGVQLR